MENSTWFSVAIGLIALGGIATLALLRRRAANQHQPTRHATTESSLTLSNARMVFGPDDKPLVEIFKHHIVDQKHVQELPLTPRIQTGIKNLLPQLPVLTTSLAIAASRTYVSAFAQR